VRPLAGGLEGWVESGYPVDGDTLIAVRPPEPTREG
jgi:hypothetical protein